METKQTKQPVHEQDPNPSSTSLRKQETGTDLRHDQNRSPLRNRPFLTDIEEIRRRARAHVEKGAVTPSYELDPMQACAILNEALATEIVCVLRYKHHYYTADGLQARSVAKEFAEHAAEEQEHADWLAVRIRQLGGNPELNPEGLLTRSHSEYHEGDSLIEMIHEDLVAERIAIESYREMIHYFGEKDPVSRRLLEKILEKEEEHADELSSLLLTLDPTQAPASREVSAADYSSEGLQHLPGHIRRITGT